MQIPSSRRVLAARLTVVSVAVLGMLAVRGPAVWGDDRKADDAAGAVEAEPAPDARPQARAKPEIEEQARTPARYITLASPIDDQLLSWVRESGLDLQQQALKRDEDAVLVLEVTPGNSQFHHVYGLADFLTSTALSRVKTIAWIPETVVGNNVIAALACNEIVMHPDAELGDIGRGRALEEDQQTIVRSMIAKRRNPKVNRALAEGLMNPGSAVIKLTFEPQPGTTETRLVTEEEAKAMQDRGIVIRDSQTIKEAGQVGLYSGAQARNNDVLATQTLETRHDLARRYGIQLEDLREQVKPGKFNRVSLIEVKGVIDPLLESFLERQIDRAVSSGSELIIFEIDSPGGLLWQSRDLAHAIADLQDRNIRTVAYVPETALSGAAIIALGCDEIYLTPNGKFGDAGPIEMKEGGQFERAPEKVLSFLREILRELGERKNRPVALLMAMADKDLKVYEVTNTQTGDVWYMSEEEIHNANGEWEQGRLVPESAEDLLMTVNGRRAHELKIAERPVADFEELKQRLGIPEDIQPRKIGRTWLDDTVFLLNTSTVTGLLFFIGIICIYLELHFMSGFLGIIAALCFALFFWSKFLGGTAGWLEVILFLLGIGCLVMEIFVIPGFGVFGVTGGLLIFGALIMASQTFGNIEPNQDFESTKETMKILSLSLVSVLVMAIAMARFLPRIPILNQMILTPPGMDAVASPDQPRLRPDLADRSPLAALMGQTGEALTVLRPAGKARIDGRLYDVVSDGPYIDRGGAITVTHVSGNRIVVRQA
jgi:membrane-bound serine protease (ClpP class)